MYMRASLLTLATSAVIGRAHVQVHPDCQDAVHQEYRTITGACNNLADPNRGKTDTPFTGERYYADGVTEGVHEGRPLAREVDLELLTPGAHADAFCDPALEQCELYPDTVVNNVNKGWFDESEDSQLLSAVTQSFGNFVVHDLAFSDNDEGTCPGLDFNLLLPEERLPFKNDDPFLFFNVNFLVPEGAQGTHKSATTPQWGIFFPSLSEIGDDGVRRSVNHASSYLDMSQVYGNNEYYADLVREDFSTGTGFLKEDSRSFDVTTIPRMPPFDASVNGPRFIPGMPLTADITTEVFSKCQESAGHFPESYLTCGDKRCAENVQLLGWHILYNREHNRLAAMLKEAHSDWDGEKLFHEARKINTAQYQNHVREWFRTLTGDDETYIYQGYDEDTDASTTVSTAFLMRMHTVIVDKMHYLDECAEPTAGFDSPFLPPVFQNHGFTSAGQRGGPISERSLMYMAGGVENLVRGSSRRALGAIDHVVSEVMQVNLFKDANITGLSVPTLTLHRAREDGVPHYDRVREIYMGKSLRHEPGCFCVKWKWGQCVKDSLMCFMYITGLERKWGGWGPVIRPGNKRLAKKLRQMYKTVENVDAWAGLQTEQNEALASTRGGFMGPLGRALMLDTFQKAMSGDRFWFENEDYFSATDIAQYRRHSLRDLVISNADPSQDRERLQEFLQENLFFLPDERQKLVVEQRCAAEAAP